MIPCVLSKILTLFDCPALYITSSGPAGHVYNLNIAPGGVISALPMSSRVSEQVRYDGKVAIVTGAGGGLGKAYALYFASRGASVVVNDLGGSVSGGEGSQKIADLVVAEIKKLGGKAVANYDSVENGDRIVKTAVEAFGGIHIVINNAGILRDVSFAKMSAKDFQLVQQVHVFGSYKVTQAAWPYMRKQKFGRIINTSSAAGLYGNFGQTNYSAAKHALVGFTETIAKEGAKYNITANVIAPLAASRMTETIMPPEVLEQLKPETVVPVVGYLVNENCTENGSIIETAAGAVMKVRWERSGGIFLKTDEESFLPSSILSHWKQLEDFSKPEYPSSPKDLLTLIEQGNRDSSISGPEVSFKDQVVVVTGAGAGIGQQYALMAARLGAKVVVNDVGNPDGTVEIIRKSGGQAVADKNDVANGEAVVKTAIDNFGGVHAVINNAGIIRDKSMVKMTDDLWNIVEKVHLFGTFSVTKAAWPYFVKQGYGRVVNTTSTSGIYGNFGQANYAAAKAGILGFTRALAVEGSRKNILVNAIAPTAGTSMTSGVFTEEMLQSFKPKFIAPTTLLLASSSSPVTGQCIESGAGWSAKTRLQRSSGVMLANITTEKVRDSWAKIADFSTGETTNPASFQEAVQGIFDLIAQVKPEYTGQGEYSYDDEKVLLYNIGVGAPATDLKYTYEGSQDFQPVPSFGVIPMFFTPFPFDEAVPNFNPMKLLHGEQFLEIKQWPIPREAKLRTDARLLDLIDKKKAAVGIVEFKTFDEATGQLLFYNVMSTFFRGSGGFNGKTQADDLGVVTRANTPPKRSPDWESSFRTSPDQAAIYRLSGDHNPLHIDPEFAAVGGFNKPILHGLCTLGISARLLTDKFGVFKNIKVRFSGFVFPGETLKVVGWKEGPRVIFETHVVERGTKAISAAAIELPPNGSRL